MADKLQSVRGAKDLLPLDYMLHEYIIEAAKKVSLLYGYLGMSTPIIEYTTIFERTLGEDSDVISKEIYSFSDKSNNNICLRPEFTAGIIRAFISNNELHTRLPLKLFSVGPVFRYDRPQAARQRQFHQVNFEHIGAENPYTDAEIIKCACCFLTNIGIIDDITLEINSLGCVETRILYQKALVKYFSDYKLKLSKDSQIRLIKNPMRILDSKDEIDQEIIANSPIISEYYTSETDKYFNNVKKYLDLLSVNYVVNPRLERGLDYYCHTAFEFITNKLGAQSTILAGGRYDGLSELMGGPKTKAIGFAAGVE